MIHFMERGARALRRALSRNEWSLRLLHLPKTPPADATGLVLIQIDGLARPQLEKALRRGRMPFLRSLLRREGYQIHSLYSGMPSTTPAAQAEIFYGKKCAVPAFSFRRHQDGTPMQMLRADSAGKVEAELEKTCEPLFRGGSCYSNIYTGGAAEPHFCASRLSAAHLLRSVNPLGLGIVVVLNLTGILRLLALLAVEAVLAVYDAVRGAIALGEYRQEFLFLFSRVLVCVGLREVITAMAGVDVTRGLPVVQVNFGGYDEQSHRRGPSSALAHFGLRGIDGSLKRIFRAAHRSAAREYEVWIYSDHGQETALPYWRLKRETLEQTVSRCLQTETQPTAAAARLRHSQDPTGLRMEEMLLRRSAVRKAETVPPRGGFFVAALGPVAHVYLPADFSGDRGILARKLVEEGSPLALFPLGDGMVRVYNAQGAFLLPRDAAEVLGAKHPFLEICAADLVVLCRHPDAGDIVLCGWRPQGKPVTFAFENGAHGGPGFSETHAFALLPRHQALGSHGPARHLDLRAAVQSASRQSHGRSGSKRLRDWESSAMLRVMTYNVHGLQGMDGRESPDRIARVIAGLGPDVIALQECDEGQLRALRNLLVTAHHYPENLGLVQDAFGNALLAVVPWQQPWKETLPAPPGFHGEQRGVVGGALRWRGMPLHICNTHFGLAARERVLQARALRARMHAEGPSSWIVAGDFNAGPHSSPMALLGRDLRDAQRQPGRRARNTFFGRVPLSRIDHIFLSPSLQAEAAEVPRNYLTRVASDHLPLIVDVVRVEGAVV